MGETHRLAVMRAIADLRAADRAVLERSIEVDRAQRALNDAETLRYRREQELLEIAVPAGPSE